MTDIKITIKYNDENKKEDAFYNVTRIKQERNDKAWRTRYNNPFYYHRLICPTNDFIALEYESMNKTIIEMKDIADIIIEKEI